MHIIFYAMGCGSCVLWYVFIEEECVCCWLVIVQDGEWDFSRWWYFAQQGWTSRRFSRIHPKCRSSLHMQKMYSLMKCKNKDHKTWQVFPRQHREYLQKMWLHWQDSKTCASASLNLQHCGDLCFKEPLSKCESLQSVHHPWLQSSFFLNYEFGTYHIGVNLR